MKEFKIMPEGRHSYIYATNDHATVDAVWLSEKNWFMTGTEVVIQDTVTGEIKWFVKES